MTKSISIKMSFIGEPGRFVTGYPQRDVTVTSEKEAAYLEATGCYERATPKKKKGTVNNE